MMTKAEIFALLITHDVEIGYVEFSYVCRIIVPFNSTHNVFSKNVSL